MRFISAVVSAALLSSSLAWAAESGSAREYYRYRDANGVMRISQGIPPEFSKLGYEIISADGTVLKKVPRELQGDELKAVDKQREAEEAAKKQLKNDQALLRRYSTPADIESARNRAINDIKIRIGIINSNLLSLKQQIEREQSRAANLERSGQPVPQELSDNIRALSAEVDETERTIEQRQLEIKQEENNYQADIDRLKFLLERIHGKR
jgi:chromosome segregation ATPase